MGAGFSESNAIPSVRQLAGTNGPSIGNLISWEGRQGHGNNAVTAIHSFQNGGLRASFSKGDTIPSVRQQTGTNGSCIGDLIGREGCQGHGNNAVAAIHSFKGSSLGAGFGEGDTVPSVGQLARTNGAGVCL